MAAVGRWVLEGSSTRIRQMAAQHHGSGPAARTDPGDAPRQRQDRPPDSHEPSAMSCSPRTRRASSCRRISTPPPRPLPGTPSVRSTRRTPPRWRARGTVARARAARGADAQREVAQHLQHAREVVERHRQALEAAAERQRSCGLAAEEARRQRELEAQAAAAAAAEQAHARGRARGRAGETRRRTRRRCATCWACCARRRPRSIRAGRHAPPGCARPSLRSCHRRPPCPSGSSASCSTSTRDSRSSRTGRPSASCRSEPS